MYDQIASNKRRSIALVAAFVVVLALVGAAVGVLIGNGIVFTVIALVIAGGGGVRLVLEGRRDRAAR